MEIDLKVFYSGTKFFKSMHFMDSKKFIKLCIMRHSHGFLCLQHRSKHLLDELFATHSYIQRNCAEDVKESAIPNAHCSVIHTYQKCKQHRCPLLSKWIRKGGMICNDLSFMLKKRGFSMTWLKLDQVCLSKISQLQEDKSCRRSLRKVGNF